MKQFIDFNQARSRIQHKMGPLFGLAITLVLSVITFAAAQIWTDQKVAQSDGALHVLQKTLHAQEDRLSSLEAMAVLTGNDDKQDRLFSLKRELSDQIALLETLESDRNAARHIAPTLSVLFEQIDKDLVLGSIVIQDKGVMIVTGKAHSMNAVPEFIARTSTLPGVKEYMVSGIEITQAGDAVHDFVLTLTAKNNGAAQ